MKRVALITDMGVQTGTVIETKENKSLVNFEKRGYKRWVKTSNLESVK